MVQLVRYALDPTGTNPDNKVVGEVQQLSVKQRRALIPKYGPFFKEGFVLKDVTQSGNLIEGTHFHFVDISDELTRQYGKAIYHAILIVDATVSDTVRVDYQLLGGLHMNNSANLKLLYENMMANDAPVDWTTDVVNKPSQFPPSLHSHYIGEWRGFEPIIAQLERMRNAIILSNIPAFEQVFDWVKSRSMTVQDVINGTTQDKYVTMDVLEYMQKNSNFNVLTVTPERPSASVGGNTRINVSASLMEDGTVLYWDLDLDGMVVSDFDAHQGSFTINDRDGTFLIGLESDIAYNTAVRFRFRLRVGGQNGMLVYTSRWIHLSESAFRLSQHAAMNACCFLSPRIARTATTLAIAGLSHHH